MSKTNLRENLYARARARARGGDRNNIPYIPRPPGIKYPCALRQIAAVLFLPLLMAALIYAAAVCVGVIYLLVDP